MDDSRKSVTVGARGALDTLHHRFARLPWFESEHARALRAYLRRAVGLRFRCVQPVTDAPGAHQGGVPKQPARALPLPTELTKEVNLPRIMELAHGGETQFNKSLGEIGELRESMAHLSGQLEGLRPGNLTHLPGREAPPARPGTPTAPARRPHRFPTLARAALGCVLALAVLATPALAQAPAAVSDVVVVPVPRSTTSLTVSWSAPDNVGKPAITGYDVRYADDGDTNWTTVRQDAPSTSVIITGLRSNTYYGVQVRALNTGSGPWSSTAEGASSPRPETLFANHPLIPDDLEVGDSFRLLFITGAADNVLELMPLTAATGTGIHDYTNLVLDPVIHIVEPGNFMNRWGEVFLRQTALVSLPGADARLLTDTTWTATDRGVPIYWLNGARVADDYADFYDGTWADEANPRDGLAQPYPLEDPAPWTGTDHDGTELFDGAASRAMGQATVGVGGLGSSAVGAGPLNGRVAFAKTEERPLYGLWHVMVVGANRRLVDNIHVQRRSADEGPDERAAVRAQLFTTGPDSYGYSIAEIKLSGTDDDDFLGPVALYTTDEDGNPDLEDGLHATLILENNYGSPWKLKAPEGKVLKPTTTYALVFLGESGSYPDLWTIAPDGEAHPAEGWSLADALLYRSGTSWVEDPDGRSLQLHIIGPRLVDLDPVVSIRNRSIREDIGTAVLTVTLSWPSRVSVSVPWSTSELDAVSPDDYTDGRGVLTFAPGATEATIFIPIADDTVPEEVESFAVTLGPGEGYRANSSSNVAFAKILDNDGDELVPSRATVNGTTLLLTYNEILDSASTPSPSHFYVTADDNRVDVDQVSVGGSMVMLTLATAVEAGQTVLLDYVSGVGQNQIQDGEGNAAMSFTDWLVTNITGGGTNPPGRPAAPSVSATAGSGTSLDVTWAAPSNTGPAITSYDLQYRQGTSGNFTTGPQNVTVTSAAIGGLTPNTSYQVQVRATNADGDGDWSFSGTGQTGASVPPGDGGGGGGGFGGGAGTANNFPTADAGPDQSGVWEGALVMLDGSGSSHPDDEPLRYRWNQLSGEPVALSSRNIVNPTFTAPQGLTADAVLRFRLLVTGPEGRFDSDTVTITVDPEAEPPPAGDQIYNFPHLAVGEGWQTTITYINYSPEEVSCRTEFLSDQGTPLMVSFAGRGTVANWTDTLPPGGSVHEETNVELSAPLARGWARATCSGPLKASLLYRRFEEGVPTGEAGVNAATVPATRFVTFAEQGEGRFGTGVAYANPSDTEAVITFRARDAAGEVLASVDQTLLPNGHDAKNMVDLFDLTSFSGSLEVTSTAPIVSLSLNNEADPVFSSLPPGEVDAAAQGPQEMTTYYFTHLAVGASWQTTITYINYSLREVSCETDFISDFGSPLMVSFADRGTVISRSDVVPPGGSLHEETNVDLSTPLARGWARATCSGPLKASLLYRRRNSEGVPTGEAGVNATTVPASRFVTFAEKGEGRYGTGVAYANPSDTTTAFVTFTAKDADGETLASVDETLLPNGHDAQNMVDLFDLTSFSGSLEVTSTEPIVSLSLNNEADPVFSSLPPGELDDAAQ